MVLLVFLFNLRVAFIRVGQLPLQNLEGVRVPLQSLADIYETSGRCSIAHEGSRRRQAISCNVEGRDLASFVAELQQALRTKMQFPRRSGCSRWPWAAGSRAKKSKAQWPS